MYKHFTGNIEQSHYIEGVDISHHQGRIDWQQLTPDHSGKQFIWREAPPKPNELPKGWNDWDIWQYTDKGQVPGIAGPVDLNRMKVV